MQERHQNKEQYFKEQETTTGKFVIPYLTDTIKITAQTEVLEIGCAEAGNLKPFLDMGCLTTGIDISCGRIDLARQFFADHPNRNRLELICADIYKVDLKGKTFDLIIMRDVIEHIPNQEMFMHYVKLFLKPDGRFFIAFPPWQNPFGGHQQVCNNRVLSKLPWFHLLPRNLYKLILDTFERNQKRTKGLLDIKETGLSIDRFERILRFENYKIEKRTFYLINPNYHTKFNIRPRKQISLVTAIPYIRNFFTTAAYYIVSKQQ